MYMAGAWRSAWACFDAVPIIEIHVSAGDQVNAEDPLITLESGSTSGTNERELPRESPSSAH